ncbi:unnamed protein product [Amoebophrya sp. A120]|nr:unnamed protein product [Amoebophrya sp. A120]|eukprot:GSA120T00013683001.1
MSATKNTTPHSMDTLGGVTTPEDAGPTTTNADLLPSPQGKTCCAPDPSAATLLKINKNGPTTIDKPVPTGPEVKGYSKRAGKRKQVVMHRYKKLELRYTCQLRMNKKTKLGAATAAAGAQMFGVPSLVGNGVQAVRTSQSTSQNLLKQKAARLGKDEPAGDGKNAAAAADSSAPASSDAAEASGEHAGDFAVTAAGDQRSDATAGLSEAGPPGVMKKTAFLAKTGTGRVQQEKKVWPWSRERLPARCTDSAWDDFKRFTCDKVARTLGDARKEAERASGARKEADAIEQLVSFKLRAGIALAPTREIEEALADADEVAQANTSKAKATWIKSTFSEAEKWKWHADALQMRREEYALDAETFPGEGTPCSGSKLGKKFDRLFALSKNEGEKFTKGWHWGLIRDVDFAAASMACEIVNSPDCQPKTTVDLSVQKDAQSFCAQNRGFGLRARLGAKMSR